MIVWIVLILLMLLLGGYFLYAYTVTNTISKAGEELQKSKTKISIILGDYGKSSTTHYISQYLDSVYNPHSTIEVRSFFDYISFINSLKKYTNCKHVFVIISSPHILWLDKLFKHVSVSYCLLTGFAQSSSIRLQNQIQSLIKDTPKNCTFIVNWDSGLLSKIEYPAGRKIQRFAIHSPHVEWKINSIHTNEEGSDYILVNGSNKYSIETEIISKGEILNLTLATIFLHQVGYTLAKLVIFLKDVSQPPKAIRIFSLGKALIIDNSMNSNATGIYNSLDLVRNLKKPALLFINVEKRRDNYTELIDEIVELEPVIIILIGPRAYRLQNLLSQKGFSGYNILLKEADTEGNIQNRLRTEIDKRKELLILFEGEGVSRYIEDIVSRLTLEV